jgi:hypothetical protein
VGDFGRVQVELRDEALHLASAERGQSVPARPLDANRLTCAWGLIQFIEDAGSAVQLKVANYHPLRRL